MFPANAFQVSIAGDRLDLVRDVVVLQESRQDSAAAEGVGLECDEDENGRRERVACALQVQVQLRDEGTR